LPHTTHPILNEYVRISCAESDRVLEEAEVSESLKKRLSHTSTTTEYQKVGPTSTIQLRTIRLEKRDRTQALRRKLLVTPEGAAWDRVLVFVSTRYASVHVASKLRRLGIKSAELHGKLDQDAHIRRLSDFALCQGQGASVDSDRCGESRLRRERPSLGSEL
jgi:superfamily II DNA/RNA helicase